MKTTKRIFALLMAIVLLAGMAVSAFAVEPAIPDGEKLTINTEKDHTYYIYQLLVGDPYNSVDFPDDPETDVIVDGQVFGLVDSLSNVKAGKHLLTEPKPNGSLPADDDEKEEAVKDFIAAMIPDDVPLTPEQIGDTAYAWTYTNDTDTAYVLYGSTDGGEKSVRVDKGYYIIIDTLNDNVDHDGHGDTGNPNDDNDYDRDTVSRYMVAVVGDTKVSPKKVTPDIDKKIVDTDSNEAFANSDGKADTAAIGDEIEFEITGKVPDMTGYKYYYYNVQDTLSDGLTLDTNSFEVYITRPDLKGEDMAVYGSGTTKATEYVLVNSDDADADTEEKDIYYVYTGNDAKPYTFILAFENLMELADKTNPNGVIPGDVIHIRYKATVNKDALVGNLANTNEADLKFSNNPSDSNRKDEDDDKPGLPDDDVITGLTPKKKTYTFVTELTIFKTDENGLPLKGAQFTLSGVNINQLVIEDEEQFVLATVKKDDCAFTTAAEKAETGYDGEAQCSGLGHGHGEYYKLIKYYDNGVLKTYNTDEVVYTQTPPTGNLSTYYHGDETVTENGVTSLKYSKTNPLEPTFIRVENNGNEDYREATAQEIANGDAKYYKVFTKADKSTWIFTKEGPNYGSAELYEVASGKTEPTPDYHLVVITKIRTNPENKDTGEIGDPNAEVKPVPSEFFKYCYRITTTDTNTNKTTYTYYSCLGSDGKDIIPTTDDAIRSKFDGWDSEKKTATRYAIYNINPGTEKLDPANEEEAYFYFNKVTYQYDHCLDADGEDILTESNYSTNYDGTKEVKVTAYKYKHDDVDCYWNTTTNAYVPCLDSNSDDILSTDSTDDNYYGNFAGGKSETVYTASKYALVKSIVGYSEDEDDQAAFSFIGLNRGNYVLTESKTPTGYNTINDIRFEIKATWDPNKKEITWSLDPDLDEIIDNDNIVFTIQNKTGNIMPETGGIGTTLFYVLGAILVLGAGVLLVTRKRLGK